jgi:TIR domain-containing protein
MPKIAISYRRTDSSAIAGRIADRLAARYGKESVFIDVDSVPFGIDFRKYIQEVWSEIGVLIVVVGPRWLGVEKGAAAAAIHESRIHERRDVVRIEVEMALKRDVPIIPILVDGAIMPTHEQLPRSLRTFSNRNAAEVDGGRDFHPHMDRLIQAIDRIAGERTDHLIPGLVSTNSELVEERIHIGGPTRGIDRQALTIRSARLLRDTAIPVFVLVVLHHLIVNVFDLDTIYLRIASFVVPFLLGVFTFWRARWERVVAFAVAASVGLISVAAMTVSQGVNSGRPIMPSTTFEWRESVEYVVSIACGFLAGYLLARSPGIWSWKRPR